MSDKELTEKNDEFVNAIQTAFEAQSIPPTPSINSSEIPIRSNDSRQFRRWMVDHHSYTAAIAGSIPVIVAGVLLTIAIWPAADTSLAESNTETVTPPAQAPDEQKSPDDTVPVVAPPDGIVAQSPTDIVKPTIVESDLYRAIRSLNDFIERKNTDAKALASTLDVLSPGNEEALLAGISSMGVPIGIKRVTELKQSTEDWLHDADEIAFGYKIDTEVLLSDLERFVNSMLGEKKIFLRVLDGIRDDPEGPKIDLRGELLARFKGEVILIINQHLNSTGNRLMVVIPVKEADQVSKVVTRMFAFEAKTTDVERIGGVDVYVTNSVGRPANGFAVANNCLIVGEGNMVRKAIMRLTKNR